jgi:nucleoside-triphosphatase THEP1
MNPPVFIVTGGSGSGKTTTMLQLFEALTIRNIKVGGLLAMGTWKNNRRDRFELVNLFTGDRIVYCQRDPVETWESLNRFYINPDGQTFGERALNRPSVHNAQVIIIDEIGPFEMQGKGWAQALEGIVSNLRVPLVISVRKSLMDEVIRHWSLDVQGTVDAGEGAHLLLLEEIRKFMKT